MTNAISIFFEKYTYLCMYLHNHKLLLNYRFSTYRYQKIWNQKEWKWDLNDNCPSQNIFYVWKYTNLQNYRKIRKIFIKFSKLVIFFNRNGLFPHNKYLYKESSANADWCLMPIGSAIGFLTVRKKTTLKKKEIEECVI